MGNSAKIGVTTATIIGMNAMIGAGIFAAPAAIGSQVGPAGILAFLFVVCAVWFMAQSLARLTQLYPQEGSFYTYASQWGGHTVGMIASICYLVGLVIAMGLLCQLAGMYLFALIPCLTPNTLGLITLFSLVLLNMVGVKFSELGQQILIVCTVFPLIAITIMCLTKANFANLTPFAPFGFSAVLKGTRIAIFGFFGFECVTSLFNIVKDPGKNVSRAVTYSIVIVGTIYTLFIASIVLAIPMSLFTSPEMPITEPLKAIFAYDWIITFLNFAILAAIMGTIHSMIWGTSHLLFAVFKQVKNASIQSLVAKNQINQTMCVVAIGVGILLTYLTMHNIDLLFNLTAIFIVASYVLSMITLLTLKSEWQSGQTIKTILGILTACAIVIFAGEGLIQELIKLL